MGKRDNFNQNAQNTEKEFKEMKDRLYKDNVIRTTNTSDTKPSYNRERNNDNRPDNRRNWNNDNYRSRKPEGPVTPPESHTKDFTAMLERVIIAVQAKSPIVIHNFIDNSKEDTGVICIKIHGARSTDVTPETEPGVLFYYIEDHNIINPKNPRPMRQYPAMILIINQSTGRTLFTKFGPRCIEQAEKYVTRIIEKEVSFVQKENKSSNS